MQELRGMPVVNDIIEKLKPDLEILKIKNIFPKLAVVRVGSREDDLSYEKGIIKRFSAVDALVEVHELPLECSQNELETLIGKLNSDQSVHGILLFRPLPKSLSEENIRRFIQSEKDIDCMGTVNTAKVFEGARDTYPPCTPQAVIELLDFYSIDVCGKKVAIIGRSMVVGKPLAMLLLGKNATVTICHTKTKDLAAECKNADIIIACAGVAKMLTADYIKANQTVIDVGINMLDGKLCGDVDYEGISALAGAATPVPGGVGTITTAVLLKHTVKSAVSQIHD